MNETVPVSPAKYALMFGVLFGVLMILEFVISYVADIDPVSNPSYGIILNVLNMLVFPVLFITIPCNNFKKMNLGYISLGQCLKIGVTVCLIAGLLSALFQSVFTVIFPEYMDEIIHKTRQVILQKSPDMPAESLEMALSWTRKFMQPQIMIPVSAVTYSFIGLFFSLIIGLIVKKDKPQSI